MPNLAEYSFHWAHMLVPLFVLITGIVISLVIKNAAENIAGGFSFKMGQGYRRFEEVELKQERAIIVSIGATNTVFRMLIPAKDGRDRYRIVYNSRLKFEEIYKLGLKPEEEAP